MVEVSAQTRLPRKKPVIFLTHFDLIVKNDIAVETHGPMLADLPQLWAAQVVEMVQWSGLRAECHWLVVKLVDVLLKAWTGEHLLRPWKSTADLHRRVVGSEHQQS